MFRLNLLHLIFGFTLYVSASETSYQFGDCNIEIIREEFEPDSNDMHIKSMKITHKDLTTDLGEAEGMDMLLKEACLYNANVVHIKKEHRSPQFSKFLVNADFYLVRGDDYVFESNSNSLNMYASVEDNSGDDYKDDPEWKREQSSKIGMKVLSGFLLVGSLISLIFTVKNVNNSPY
jgi:hypothetical protein